MKKDNSFTLDELDDKFWEKVIFFQIENSSGLGGPGCLWLITSDKKLYYIGFEGFPYSEFKLGEFNSLFEWVSDEKDKFKCQLKAGEIGYVKHSKETVYIKEKYYDVYCREWQKEWDMNIGRIHYVHAPIVMARTLGLEKIERYDWAVSVEKQEEHSQWIQKCDEEHKQRELSEEYFEWYPLYWNNYYEDCYDERGWYCVLLKKVEEKITGTRFTIMYQREEVEPLHMIGIDAPIEKYVLFEKRYSDVIGPLRFSDSKKSNMSWEESILAKDIQYTFSDMELNDRGEFVRVFDSLEEAKKYAVAVANIRSYANIDNVITKDQLRQEEATIMNASLERKYNAIIMFRKYAVDIIKAICEYEFPSESAGGGGYVIPAVAEKLGIDIELMWEMAQYIPMELLPRRQRKAIKILKEIRKK